MTAVANRTLIRGGTVVDGTGAPGRLADVLIEGGRIASIDSADTRPAPEAIVIDARGSVVTPGFIDVHAHADFTVLAFPGADGAVRQGVTTVVNGNCGGGVAPAEPEHNVRRVAFAYDSSWGVEIGWRTFGEYVDRLRDLAVNAATLVPHGALRNAVLGLEDCAPTRAELARMEAMLDEALTAGGIGLSSGLEYQSGCYANVDELAALAKVVASHDGVYATHIRNRGERFAAATREAIEVARRGEVRLQLSHFAPRPYAPARETAAARAAVHELAESGQPVWVDTFPEIWGPGLLLDLFPREVVAGTREQVLSRLGDQATRDRVERWFERGENFLVRAAGYERIHISSSPTHPEHNGRSLTDLAAAAGTTVAGYASAALLEAGEAFPAIGIRHVYATEDDLRELLRLPHCSLGSDGVVTCGEGRACPYRWSASSYGYVARALEHYVREIGVFALEDAVRRLAALPAQAMGLHDRGTLAAGKVADVVVLDPRRVTDRTTPEDMARHPAGIDHVLVGGISVVSDGRTTGARPGGAVRAS